MRNSLLNIVAVAMLGVQTGCALNQTSAVVPDLGLTDDLMLNNSEVVVVPDMKVEWWKLFGDPVLDEIVRQALDNNSDIRIALTNIEKARALQNLGQWQFLPSADLSLSAERQRFSDSEQMYPKVSETLGAGMQVQWEPDLFGRIRANYEITNTELLSSEITLSAVRLLVVTEVTATYLLARAVEDRLAARELARDQSLRIVEVTRIRVEEARESEDILAHALAELAILDVALLNEAQLANSFENRLAVLLSQQPGYWRLPARSSSIGPLQIVSIATGNISALLNNRPDIRLAEQALRKHQLQVDLARTNYLPRLTLSGFFGLVAGGIGDLGKSGALAWNAGPSLVWNALDFGRTRNIVKANEAELSGELVNYEQTVLRALEEAQNALSRLTTAQRGLAFRESQRQYAVSAAAASQARFEEGYGSYIEMLIAQRDSVIAEIARIDGITGHRLATVDVFKAMGPSF